MKRIFALISIALLISNSCKKKLLRDRTITFSEEFEGTNLDTSVWETGFPWGQQLYGTEESYFVDSAFTVKNGYLYIHTKKQKTIGTVFDPSWNGVKKGFDFSSGLIQSDKSFAQQYGYFEIRAKVPIGKGLWPAFWLMAYSGWPPEIDVFEIPGREPHLLHTTNHFSDKNKIHKQNGNVYKTHDLSENFHLYGIEWNPYEIIWYLDKKVVFRSSVGVPHEPMYLIASISVGGSEFAGYSDHTTPAESEMVIDYIRVYALDD